jgi:DNA polymerase elongation subunit (family B)
MYDKTLEVHTYELNVDDKALDENDERHVEIQLWCFDKKSSPMLLRVRDFPVFCKIKLPPLITRRGPLGKWNRDLCDDLVNAIKRKLKTHGKEESSPIKFQYQLYDDLYYYSEKKKPFLLLIFNTIDAMFTTSRRCKYIYFKEYGKIELKYYEMDVDIFNKMFSLRDMGPTEKFTCKAKEIEVDDEDRISKSGPPERPFKEYVIDWRSIIPCKEATWISQPRICSFDIEVYSHKHRCFPQKQHFKDVMFSISVVMQQFMKPETRKDIMIIIGPTYPHKDVEIHYVKDEFELMEKFYEIVEREDPDVFTGYNIFGFDYDYMNVRIEDVGLEWKNIGRLKERGCHVKNKTWQSNAFGNMNMYILDCPGRISIDMLPYIKREHKLPKYSLNVVSQHFMGLKKVDLKPIEMFEIYQEMQVNISRICSATGEKDYRDAMKLVIEDPKAYLAKKDQRKLLKIIEDNTKVIDYNVVDSYLVIQLFEKLNVWVALIELANIVRVNPTDCFTRGQQKRCIAQLYHAASSNGIVMTRREKEPIYYNGGFVEHPRPGLWDCVMCFDFNSLYPSIMIAYNICFTTLIREQHIRHIDDEKQHYFHIEQEEPVDWKPGNDDNFDYGEFADDYVPPEEKKKGETIHREYDVSFIKKEVREGLLPMVLKNLLSERKKKKKEMKKINKIVDLIDEHILKPYNEGLIKKISDINCNQMKEKYLEDNKDEDPDEIKPERLDKAKEEFLSIIKEAKENHLLSEYYQHLSKEFFAMKVQAGIYDAQQLGLKVSANSLYGFLGTQKFSQSFSLVEAGMTVTGIGRDLIIKSSKFFEDNYKAITVYGDSIPGYEPVLLKNEKDEIFIEKIDKLVKTDQWFPYEGFKVGESNRREKQQAIVNLWSWSKGKWNKIKRVIRHKTSKNIYEIKCGRGSVHVTEDHSLLTDTWEKIKPEKLQINKTKLATSYPEIDELDNTRYGKLGDPGKYISRKNEAERFLCLHKNSYYHRLDREHSSNNIVNSCEIIRWNYEDFVYDIETENGFYQAGVGEINIKNTDSTMVHIPGLSRQKMDAMAYKMEQDINGHPDIFDKKTGELIKPAKESIFPSPLMLEYEKGMYGIFMRKKMYMYMELVKGKVLKIKGTNIDQINYKGVVAARRDSCTLIISTFDKIARAVFDKKDIRYVFKIIINAVLDIMNLNLNIEEDLTLIREMKSNYKSKTFSSAIFSELMKGIQRPVNPGERFSYVIVNDHKCREKLGYKMRTYEMFVEQWETSPFKYGDNIPLLWKNKNGLFPPEEIDAKYYVCNKLIGPIDTIFHFSFARELHKYKHIVYKPKFRRLGLINVGKPVEMISKIFEDHDALIAKKGIKIMIPIIESLLDDALFDTPYPDGYVPEEEKAPEIEIEEDK